MARSPLLNIMTEAVTKAGRLLARDFGEIQNLQVSLKSPQAYAQQTRQKASKVLLSELSKARPEYAVENSDAAACIGNMSENLWIINPIDGFTSFLHGVPLFSVWVALRREQQIIAAALYNPATGELYTAERGNGAFMNDRRLRVSSRNHLEDSLIGINFPEQKATSALQTDYLSRLQTLLPFGPSICCTGSEALGLGWLAAGRIDGFWKKSYCLSDLAAGVLLVREAGGFVLQTKSGEILGGNRKIYETMLQIFTISSE